MLLGQRLCHLTAQRMPNEEHAPRRAELRDEDAAKLLKQRVLSFLDNIE